MKEHKVGCVAGRIGGSEKHFCWTFWDFASGVAGISDPVATSDSGDRWRVVSHTFYGSIHLGEVT